MKQILHFTRPHTEILERLPECNLIYTDCFLSGTKATSAHTDRRRHINTVIRFKWQSFCDEALNNKLHAIQPSLGCWSRCRRNARREVLMVRIPMKHTYLTHSYLWKREDQQLECVGYACPLTDQHIMIDCVDFAHIRSRFLDVESMKDLFDSVTPSTILLYVRAIGLFTRYNLKLRLGLSLHLNMVFFFWLSLFKCIFHFRLFWHCMTF